MAEKPFVLSRIHRNTLYALTSSASRLIANFLMFAGIARIFGPESFGQFTLAHTYFTLFYLLADFGIDILVASEVARDRIRFGDVVKKFLPLRFTLAVVAVLILNLAGLVTGLSAQAAIYISIFSLCILANAVSLFFFATFKGLEDLRYEALTAVFQNVALLVGLVIVWLAEGSLLDVAWVFAGTRFLGMAVIVTIGVRRGILRHHKFSLREWNRAFPESFPFGARLLFGTLYFQIDTLLLGMWSTDRAVGLYQAVMKLAMLVLVIPDVVVAAALPVLSRLHAQDPERWSESRRLLRKSLTYLSLPIAMTFFFSESILTLVYGPVEFLGAAPLMRIFAVILVVRFSAEAFALMITTARRQEMRTWIVIGAALVNVALNAFAIPRYGILGAAIVTLVTNILAGSCYYLATHVWIVRMPGRMDRRELVVFALSIGCAAAIWLSGMNSMLLALPLIAVAYAALYYFLGYSKQELDVVLSLRGR
jgi:O-antigen/teichoic acid export membrane protein